MERGQPGETRSAGDAEYRRSSPCASCRSSLGNCNGQVRLGAAYAHTILLRATFPTVQAPCSQCIKTGAHCSNFANKHARINSGVKRSRAEDTAHMSSADIPPSSTSARRTNTARSRIRRGAACSKCKAHKKKCDGEVGGAVRPRLQLMHSPHTTVLLRLHASGVCSGGGHAQTAPQPTLRQPRQNHMADLRYP